MRGKMGKLFDFMHVRLRPRAEDDALHIAAYEGDTVRIGELITERGADPNLSLATMMSASIERTALFLAIQEHNLAAARLLVELGADPDLRDAQNVTPLMSAAALGNIDLVQLLLDLGADPNAYRDSDHASPLSFSIHEDDPDAILPIVSALIAAGADPEGAVAAGQSVLMLAARQNLPAVIRTLLAAGADPDRTCTLTWALGWTALDHAIHEASANAQEVLAPVTTLPVTVLPVKTS
jgi:uncharacterized protein